MKTDEELANGNGVYIEIEDDSFKSDTQLLLTFVNNPDYTEQAYTENLENKNKKYLAEENAQVGRLDEPKAYEWGGKMGYGVDLETKLLTITQHTRIFSFRKGDILGSATLTADKTEWKKALETAEIMMNSLEIKY